MAKIKHTILTEDGVLTQEALLAYAEGSLSDADRSQMEKLLGDDPFAQEALEGLRKSLKPGEIHTVVSSINTQLREKTGMREKKKKGIEIHWANYAYAAVVLGVLIGLAFVMIHIFSDVPKEEAMNKPMPKAQESVPIMEEKKKEEPKPDTAKSQVATGQKDTMINTAKPTNNTLTSSGTPASAATTMSGAASNAASGDARQDIKPAMPASNGSNMVPTPAANMVSAPAQQPAMMGAETAAQLGVARNYFGAGDYLNAGKKYNEILASQPDNADALYFGGICAFYNEPGMGEANFDKLIKMGLYAEGAKWYKANVLLRKGKKEDAKPLLHDLTLTNGYFKERSVKQYEDLYGKQ